MVEYLAPAREFVSGNAIITPSSISLLLFLMVSAHCLVGRVALALSCIRLDVVRHGAIKSTQQDLHCIHTQTFSHLLNTHILYIYILFVHVNTHLQSTHH